MFEYIKGTLVSITPNEAVVDVGGLGYLLHIPLTVFAAMPPVGKEITFYVSPVIREESHKNFGFLSLEERNLFEIVSSVTGIGAKTALALIGHLDFAALETAIQTANAVLISKVPGIGKKTAERLIVELQDKLFKGMRKRSMPEKLQIELSEKDQIMRDATSALIQLGYTPLNAEKAIRKAVHKHPSHLELSALIRSALSHA